MTNVTSTTVSMAAEDETIRIRVPIKMKKRAGRREVVAAPAEPAPQEALLRAIARACTWQAMLDAGEVSSINALATRFRVDRSYVARILRLASLAPDLVEMIANGDEPNGLSLRQLMKVFRCVGTNRKQNSAAAGMPPVAAEKHESKEMMMSKDVVQIGKDGRLYWTWQMDLVFERTWEAAMIEPRPPLPKVLEMIRRALLERHPQLQPHLKPQNVVNRHAWFRQRAPQKYAYHRHEPRDEQKAAIASVADSQTLRQLEAVKTLFPQLDVSAALARLEQRSDANDANHLLMLGVLNRLQESVERLTKQVQALVAEFEVKVSGT